MDEADFSQRAEALFLAEALTARDAPKSLGPVLIDGVACCCACGESIAPARLAAVPGAGLCTACQAEREAGA
ncbi:TraR/DksA C4-type zinc finger protein [Desulfocurvibacter africanus]|uniref:TraR/DksA C4-type zinc finger protein n=1 Tax=Desulfocurvibacter africanus TaxID=873 RepID=UPI002FD8ED4F